MKKIILPILLLALLSTAEAQQDKLVNTYSIVAIDTLAGEMAVAVQSHYFSVGSIVSWGKSGVGVVATQSFVNPAFGPDGLRLMEKGVGAEEALERLVSTDPGRAGRQLALLDVNGGIAAYTGENCIRSASHIIGENFAVQANMMLNDKVVPAMASAFMEHHDLPLPERVMKALHAAQEEGGDIRGKQSAALVVVSTKEVEHPWMDKKLELRVEDHPEPLNELDRLLEMRRAYHHVDQGDVEITRKNMEAALEEYGRAEALLPGSLELRYWKAVSLANNGELEAARKILGDIFRIDPAWKELSKRLPDAGLLEISAADFDEIMSLPTAAEAPLTRGPAKGSLIIVGGGQLGEDIIEEFMQRAGGEEARIVVIPTAMGDEFFENENALEELREHYLQYGAAEVTVLHTRDSAEANKEEFYAPLKEATGLFFTGGRQWRIADGFLNTRAHEEMFRLLERGGVIAGSSAGATIQGSYLARGDTRNNQIMMGDHEEGLGFISNIAIDQHVLARNRQFDMFDILKNRPELLGISIDESTAIVVDGDRFRVIGESYVLVYDGSFWSREGSSLKTLPPMSEAFYMLRAGDRYDMKERKILE